MPASQESRRRPARAVLAGALVLTVALLWIQDGGRFRGGGERPSGGPRVGEDAAEREAPRDGETTGRSSLVLAVRELGPEDEIRLRVSVEDSQGRRVMGAEVWLYDALDGEEPRTTDSNGQVEYEGFPVREVVARYGTGGAARSATVEPGTRHLRMVLPEPARLTGRIRDEGGRPLAGVTVRAEPTAGYWSSFARERFGRETRSDADGRFSLPGLGRGQAYNVTAAAGALVAEAVARAPDSDLVLELPVRHVVEIAPLRLGVSQLWEVSGVPVDSAGAPGTDATEQLWLTERGSRTEGRPIRAFVPPGDWTFSLYNPEKTRIRDSVSFRMPVSGARVRLVDPGAGDLELGFLRLRNPHERPMEVLVRQRGLYRRQLSMEPGEIVTLAVPEGRYDVLGALPVRRLSRTIVDVERDGRVGVALPAGEPGVRIKVRVFPPDGVALPRFTIHWSRRRLPPRGEEADPVLGGRTFLAGYVDETSFISDSGTVVDGDTVIVTAGCPEDFEYAVSAPGFKKVRGVLPESGTVWVSLKK